MTYDINRKLLLLFFLNFFLVNDNFFSMNCELTNHCFPLPHHTLLAHFVSEKPWINLTSPSNYSRLGDTSYLKYFIRATWIKWHHYLSNQEQILTKSALPGLLSLSHHDKYRRHVQTCMVLFSEIILRVSKSLDELDKTSSVESGRRVCFFTWKVSWMR